MKHYDDCPYKNNERKEKMICKCCACEQDCICCKDKNCDVCKSCDINWCSCVKCDCPVEDYGTGVNLYICGQQVFGASLCEECVGKAFVYFAGK